MTPALALLLAALAALGGCSREATIGHDFPVPVVERIPHRVGLILDPELRGHRREPSGEGAAAWSVELGQAHAALFRRILSGLFEEVVEVDAPGAAGLDATFRPEVEDYQLSTPEESHTPYTEAWVRYRMVVHGPDGAVAARWSFSGYGRSRTARLAAAAALDEATRQALRDAGAVVVIHLAEQPGVRELFSGARVAGGGRR